MTLAEVLDQLRQAHLRSGQGCRCSGDPEWGYLNRCVRGCESSNLAEIRQAVATVLRWIDGEEVV